MDEDMEEYPMIEPQPPPSERIAEARVRPPSDSYPEVERHIMNDSSLHQYADRGNLAGVKQILANNTDPDTVNSLDRNGMAPLHYAARNDHYGIAVELCNAGANVEIRSDFGQTPLHCAAKCSKTELHPKPQTSGQVLVGGRGGRGDVGIQGPQTNNQPAPSTLAKGVNDLDLASDSVVSLLVQRGADVNCTDCHGNTPLHLAATRNSKAALQDLMQQREIDIEKADVQDMTALHLAAAHDHEEICRLLTAKGAQLRITDDVNQTPLHKAVKNGNTKIVELLLEEGKRNGIQPEEMVADLDRDSNTALHLAVEKGHYNIVKLILNTGIDIDQPRRGSVTALHLAAELGDVAIVKILIDRDAAINVVDDMGSTPLHYAIVRDHNEIVSYLIKKGAKMETLNGSNMTSLLIAVKFGGSRSLRTLIEKGADIFARDERGYTAMHIACENGNPSSMRTILEHEGSRPLLDQVDGHGYQPLHIVSEEGDVECLKVLLEYGVDISSKTSRQQTALHLAVDCGSGDIVKVLLQQGKYLLNATDENSDTPMHLAAGRGHEEIAVMLLDQNASCSARNSKKWTPIDCAAANGHAKVVKALAGSSISNSSALQLAACKGHTKCVEVLLLNGANVNIKDVNGLNCLDLAILNNRADVVMYLIKSEFWKKVMSNAYIDPNTGLRETPMRKLIRKMPEAAEEVFNRCSEGDGEHHPKHEDFTVTYMYEFLDDQYTIPGDMQTSGTKAADKGDGEHHPKHEDFTVTIMYELLDVQYTITGDAQTCGTTAPVYNDDGRLVEGAQLYTNDISALKKNHPLMIMVDYERENLLAHPLVERLLKHKWNTVGRYFYYTNLITYLIFLSFFTAFALVLSPPYSVVVSESGAIGPDDKLPNATCAYQRYISMESNGTASISDSSRGFLKASSVINIIILLVKLALEVFQLYNSKLAYFGGENILEWILYVTSLLFIIPFSADCWDGFREVWQWEAGVIAVFLAWLELILIIRKLPRFGIYVVMFTHILQTFLQFIVVFILFLISFALGFHMLLQNQAAYSSFWRSLLKTTAMTIGEIDYNGIFHSDQDALLYPSSTYIIFIVFVATMSILVMNLLVGLAVDDIKGVQEQASLTRMSMQIELVLTLESMLPETITRKYVVQRFEEKPNQCRMTLSALCANGPNCVKSFINPSKSSSTRDSEQRADSQPWSQLESDVKTVVQEQENMRKQLRDEIKTESRKMKEMVKLLLKHNNIDYREDDFSND